MSNLNSSLFGYIYGLSNHIFFVDMIGVFFAEYLIYFLIVGFLAFVFKFKDWRLRIFVLCESVLAVILSRGLFTEFIRFFYPSERPFYILKFNPLISESGASFPSGHAAFLFALSFIIFVWNKKWGTWYFIFSLINGVARVFVGVHWPVDILGGIVTGIVSGLIVFLILNPYRRNLNANLEINSRNLPL